MLSRLLFSGASHDAANLFPRSRLLARRTAVRGISTASHVIRTPVAFTTRRESAHGSRSSYPCMHTRGKKTVTTVRLEDLPQGVIIHEPEPEKSDRLPAAENGVEEDGKGMEDEGPAYPTVVLQARRNMQKFNNCVLLTRVGGFYELYFEHAELYGPLLNLKVAQKKTTAGPVSMAGFPFFQLERFLKVLVQDSNRHVAIAEEFANNAADKVKSGGLLHDRRVTRIITPGTLIDENFMDPYANNYVLSIHVPQQSDGKKLGTPNVDSATLPPAADPSSPALGLAWLDLSTGQFFTQVSSLSSLPSALSRIAPREVVLDQGLESQQDHDLLTILAEDRHLITYSPLSSIQTPSDWAPMLESSIPPETSLALSKDEITAGSLLLHYVQERLQGMSMKLQPPLRYEDLQIMNVDKNSMRALEIKQTIRDNNFRGSLLHAIRRTVTKGGARLLNEWLSAPSTSLDVIKHRQDLVASFCSDAHLRDSIVLLLRCSHDSQRLVQKFALGRGDPDDLLALAATIQATKRIASFLGGADCLSSMAERLQLEGPLKLAKQIRAAIDEDGIVHQHEIEDGETSQMLALAQDIISTEGTQEDTAILPKGAVKKSNKRPTSVREYYTDDNKAWIMKPKASKALKRLHDELASLHVEKANLVDELRGRYGTASLTLRWTPAFGHFGHVKGKDTRVLSETSVGRSINSSRSTSSFHLPEWTSLGQRLETVRSNIRGEEQRVFTSLREQVVQNLVKLRRNANVLDEIDIVTSFAKLAEEQDLVRPLLNHSTATTIIGGRHPTVEGGLREQGRTFVKNDCLVGTGSATASASLNTSSPPSAGKLWLITGPNMAGKSTFLRQNALITILAQVGCYVPADYAELGIVDAIFSRVGSADNLYRDQSTFMVEMMETAHILQKATPRSFVIMDEVGRGTTPEDGTAVAFACLHRLVTVNKCRTLFATHFHKLADMVDDGSLHCGIVPGSVEMYCTDVEEDGRGGFVYVHKLQKGINRQSHALKVARLAGLPEQAIQMANIVLKQTS